MTDDEQAAMRAYFRWHWENGVAFNKHCNVTVPRWEPEGVELHLPYVEHLGAHAGIFHGGVVGALIDTAASAAVLAGHDFGRGSRIVTLSMTVNYLGSAPNEDAVAYARVTKRGGRVQYSEVKVRSASTNVDVAEGLVTTMISGEKAGLAEAMAGWRAVTGQG
ncbi:MAG: PaaI family thioesterase [Acidimicrobiia bacterium]